MSGFLSGKSSLSVVTTADIADDAITSAKIADANITSAKLASGVGETEGLNRDNRELFLQFASLSGKDRLNMEDGIVDPFTDMTDIDESTSANEEHNAAFKILPRAVAYTDLNATQFSVGDTGSFAWTGNDVVGNTTDDHISTDALDLVGDFTWEFAVGTEASNGRGIQIGLSTTVGSGGTELPTSGTQWSVNGLYGSQIDGSTVDSETAGWLAGHTWQFRRVSGTIKLYKNGVAHYTFGTTSTANLAMTIGCRGDGGGFHANEVRLLTTGVGNMTLVSDPFTADAVPATGRIYFHLTQNESITINTDVTAEISRDNGSNFTTATLALVQTLADGTKTYADSSVDISGQPSGTAMKYRIKTLNTKDVELLGVVFQWST
tara:strand:+ start:479 stop:1612 length:1134 start_codon:yes stop_codon:yes gene_type:complete